MFQKRTALMLIVATVAILAGLILLGIIERERKTKFTGVVTSMRTVMITLVACLEGDNLVNKPTPSGGNQICPTGNPADMWPVLQWNWTYEPDGSYFGNDCLIRINPSGDRPIICSCREQTCRWL